MIMLGDKEDCSAAHSARHGVAQKAFFYHKHAGTARTADELMTRKENRILRDEGLQLSHRMGEDVDERFDPTEE